MQKKRIAGRIGALLSAFAAVLGLGLAGAGSAYADGGNIHHIQHAVGGSCLDSNTGGSVYFNPCQSGNGYQEWRFIYVTNGLWHIQDVNTGLCLRVDYQYGLGTTSTCGNNDMGVLWQLWNGNRQFENGDNFACLDGNTSRPYQTQGTCVAGNMYQTWNLINI
jgi:hypothetical protein